MNFVLNFSSLNPFEFGSKGPKSDLEETSFNHSYFMDLNSKL